MATYKGIQGNTVQSLGSDPPAAQSVGQLWYNSASNVWKVAVEGSGAWASGNNMQTARSTQAGNGIQTAALAYGGDTGGASYQTATEEYDGTSWATSPASLNAARADFAGCGTTSATVAFGGTPGPQAVTETFDGSTWTTSPATLNTARIANAAAGTSTAALTTGGVNPPSATKLTETETFDGSTWTETGNALNRGRAYIRCAGKGTTTASLAFVGYTTTASPPTGAVESTESYNGSTWTTVNDLNNDTTRHGAAGTQTSALSFGGDYLPTGKTEKWDGTCWTEVANMAKSPAIYDMAFAGTSALALSGGGRTPTSAATEEWADPVYSIKTVTTS